MALDGKYAKKMLTIASEKRNNFEITQTHIQSISIYWTENEAEKNAIPKQYCESHVICELCYNVSIQERYITALAT